MREAGVDLLYLPSSDFHDSEYVGAHFRLRHYLSGFDGSAGTLLVSPDWAGLWTDGRYFLQAEQQLRGSSIHLMKQGEPGVPTIEAESLARLAPAARFAFDGRCVSASTAARFRALLEPKEIVIQSDWELADSVWPDRPPRSARPVWELPLTYAGVSREEKLAQMRAVLEREGADALVLTALDEIAWLLNLRGGDIDCTPVFLSYFLLEAQRATLFVNPAILSPDITALLEAAGVSIAPYDAVYAAAAALPAQARVLLDRKRVNELLLQSLSGSVIERPSPVAAAKAKKNSREIENIRIAHRKDGLAVTKLMYRLKAEALPKTELELAARLEALRLAQENYLEPSFPPIVGYAANGAIVHYSATRESAAPLRREGFLLVDSGGHYLEGSTDCTRSFALGPLSAAQKTHYTAVLRGHLALARARFPAGTTGHQLDALARAPLWKLALDYKHGTGHGVGYLLSVHEGPQSIRNSPGPTDVPLEAGMVLSNEPGFYLEGAYGIRLENLLLCVPAGESAFGRFLAFEPLTLIPFERDAINPAEMTQEELHQLNAYHRRVCRALKPYLEEAEARWLAEATQPFPTARGSRNPGFSTLP